MRETLTSGAGSKCEKVCLRLEGKKDSDIVTVHSENITQCFIVRMALQMKCLTAALA